MRIYDISMTLHPGMAVWPGDPPVERSLLSSIAEGGGANVSHLSLGVHAGTHVDAPCHFEPGGASVEALDVDTLIGPAQVVEITADGHVGAAELEAAGIRPGTTRLLLRTSNSRSRLLQEPAFQRQFAALTADGAEWIVRHGIRLVGVDYLSVAAFHEPGAPTHHTLLRAGVVVLEGCDLTDVPPGDYTLICAPLKIEGSDGAPARVFLIES